ncbi:Uncharacterised protein [Vibrio cholerae]|nr:Uncharacterised protein [Vibrio cholerae]
MAQSQRHHRSKSEVAESKNQTCHKGLRLPKTFRFVSADAAPL